MEPVVQTLQPLLVDVRIDLGRRDVRMPEHHLDRAQIRPVLQEMGREAVPQHVRRELADAGLDAVGREVLPETDPAHGVARAVDEDHLVPVGEARPDPLGSE